MTSPTEYSKNLQDLLRRLFQFDCADLDFGIYRIMNFKRAVLDKFIEKDLIEAVSAELDTGALAEQSDVVEQLKDVAKQIRENLGDDAIDGDGNLALKHSDTKVGRKYLALQARAGGAQSRPALEAAVFNHLYSFFSRYYDAGDFMSKRRYSKKEKYAVPYNGEEVYLHWANKDQYYIKTGEYFADYRFSAPNGVAVHFKIQAADVEKENIKGENRFFIPLAKKAAFDSKTKEIVLPFEYRPLTEQEEVKYGSRNQQEAIIAEALESVHKHFAKENTALAALIAERGKTSDGQSVSYFEHHLRQYSRRNTSDFFIHKDLKGFLTRELDFYLKNEVLGLDEMEAAGESRAAGWFQLLHTIKSIGQAIITFLAQIEDFQKKLFEKRKFILETQYCITVGNIAKEFYPEIAACESQWQEWKDLFKIEEEDKKLFGAAKKKTALRIAFLKAHPTLVIDTKYFSIAFIDRLLACFDNLDRTTDGLLIHAENFQALNLLLAKYRGKVQCIYIDPPFNTDDSQFAFKDSYRNSTWLSLMMDRLTLGAQYLTTNGTMYLHLDHNSNFYGRFLLDNIFGSNCLLNEVIWRIGWVSGYKTAADRYVRNHETIFVYGRCQQPYFEKDKARIPYRSFAEDTISTQLSKIKSAWGLSKISPLRLKLVFKDPAHNVYKTGLASGEGAYNVEDTWNCNEYEELHSNKIKRNAAEYTPRGSEITQKPEQLLRRAIEVSSREGDIIFDFFAGSGTTPAVAKKIGRKFIAVELGGYFDTDMLWRMKQVLFGKQVGISKQVGHTGVGMFKYFIQESYDDSLDNVAFNEEAGQKALQFDDYLINYMLDWETKGSDTFLNVEKMASPFDYKLQVTQDGQMGEKAVDLPETFNYLLGLHVKTRKVFHDKDRRYLVYHGTVDSRQICVIWRTTAGWGKEDFERDKKFVAEQKVAEGADEIFVNSDSVIPGARSLDPVFKARMFAPVAADGGK